MSEILESEVYTLPFRIKPKLRLCINNEQH